MPTKLRYFIYKNVQLQEVSCPLLQLRKPEPCVPSSYDMGKKKLEMAVMAAGRDVAVCLPLLVSRFHQSTAYYFSCGK